MKTSVFVLTLYQNLAAGVKKALAGDLVTLLLELLMPPLQYEALRLQQAMAVSGFLIFFPYFGVLGVGDSMCVFMNTLWGGGYFTFFCQSYPRIHMQDLCASVSAGFRHR